MTLYTVASDHNISGQTFTTKKEARKVANQLNEKNSFPAKWYVEEWQAAQDRPRFKTGDGVAYHSPRPGVKKPAYVEIRFEYHTYTATVYDVKKLEGFLSSKDVRRPLGWDRDQTFSIGNVISYGDISLDDLQHAFNRIRQYGNYKK